MVRHDQVCDACRTSGNAGSELVSVEDSVPAEQ